MQIISNEDNLYEIHVSNPVFWEKIEKNITYLSSAEFAKIVIKVREVHVPLSMHILLNTSVLD